MTVETTFIDGDWRGKCLAALQADGYTVFAPRLDGEVTRFMPCETVDTIVTDRINTDYPVKEVFFPMTETLLHYRLSQGGDESFETPRIESDKIAVLGCRPCDADAVGVLDTVFNWDTRDAFFNSRREDSLILTAACTRSDNACFCTTLGLAPDATAGSDLLIREIDDRGARVTVASEKGAAFVKAHANLFCGEPAGAAPTVADVPVKFDIDKIKPWLDAHFDEGKFWEDLALACLGCGACSYLCPTCHCFDIVDEGNWQGGERRRNYDCCSYAFFTLHASGHNPRPNQASRWRNRLNHKFKYFVERFDRRACVGCGRCIRRCGAGRDIVGILEHIASLPVSRPAAEVSS